MSCAQCEELREEIAYLKSELGLANAQERRLALRERLEVTPAEAALIERLYASRGRMVDYTGLLEALPNENDDRSYKILSTYICRIRARLGKDSIRTSWGLGYRMTPEGLQTVAATLR